MIEINTTEANLHCFLALTGHAFERESVDTNRSHGFYWSMRWLARQVLGPTWMRWLSEPL